MAAIAIFIIRLPFTLLKNLAIKVFFYKLNPAYKPAGKEAIFS